MVSPVVAWRYLDTNCVLYFMLFKRIYFQLDRAKSSNPSFAPCPCYVHIPSRKLHVRYTPTHSPFSLQTFHFPPDIPQINTFLPLVHISKDNIQASSCAVPSLGIYLTLASSSITATTSSGSIPETLVA